MSLVHNVNSAESEGSFTANYQEEEKVQHFGRHWTGNTIHDPELYREGQRIKELQERVATALESVTDFTDRERLAAENILGAVTLPKNVSKGERQNVARNNKLLRICGGFTFGAHKSPIGFTILDAPLYHNKLCIKCKINSHTGYREIGGSSDVLSATDVSIARQKMIEFKAKGFPIEYAEWTIRALNIMSYCEAHSLLRAAGLRKCPVTKEKSSSTSRSLYFRDITRDNVYKDKSDSTVLREYYMAMAFDNPLLIDVLYLLLTIPWPESRVIEMLAKFLVPTHFKIGSLWISRNAIIRIKYYAKIGSYVLEHLDKLGQHFREGKHYYLRSMPGMDYDGVGIYGLQFQESDIDLTGAFQTWTIDLKQVAGVLDVEELPKDFDYENSFPTLPQAVELTQQINIAKAEEQRVRQLRTEFKNNKSILPKPEFVQKQSKKGVHRHYHYGKVLLQVKESPKNDNFKEFAVGRENKSWCLRLDNPVVVEILKYIGKENESDKRKYHIIEAMIINNRKQILANEVAIDNPIPIKQEKTTFSLSNRFSSLFEAGGKNRGTGKALSSFVSGLTQKKKVGKLVDGEVRIVEVPKASEKIYVVDTPGDGNCFFHSLRFFGLSDDRNYWKAKFTDVGYEDDTIIDEEEFKDRVYVTYLVWAKMINKVLEKENHKYRLGFVLYDKLQKNFHCYFNFYNAKNIFNLSCEMGYHNHIEPLFSTNKWTCDADKYKLTEFPIKTYRGIEDEARFIQSACCTSIITAIRDETSEADLKKFNVCVRNNIVDFDFTKNHDDNNEFMAAWKRVQDEKDKERKLMRQVHDNQSDLMKKMAKQPDNNFNFKGESDDEGEGGEEIDLGDLSVQEIKVKTKHGIQLSGDIIEAPTSYSAPEFEIVNCSGVSMLKRFTQNYVDFYTHLFESGHDFVPFYTNDVWYLSEVETFANSYINSERKSNKTWGDLVRFVQTSLGYKASLNYNDKRELDGDDLGFVVYQAIKFPCDLTYDELSERGETYEHFQDFLIHGPPVSINKDYETELQRWDELRDLAADAAENSGGSNDDDNSSSYDDAEYQRNYPKPKRFHISNITEWVPWQKSYTSTTSKYLTKLTEYAQKLVDGFPIVSDLLKSFIGVIDDKMVDKFNIEFQGQGAYDAEVQRVVAEMNGKRSSRPLTDALVKVKRAGIRTKMNIRYHTHLDSDEYNREILSLIANYRQEKAKKKKDPKHVIKPFTSSINSLQWMLHQTLCEKLVDITFANPHSAITLAITGLMSFVNSFIYPVMVQIETSKWFSLAALCEMMNNTNIRDAFNSTKNYSDLTLKMQNFQHNLGSIFKDIQNDVLKKDMTASTLYATTIFQKHLTFANYKLADACKSDWIDMARQWKAGGKNSSQVRRFGYGVKMGDRAACSLAIFEKNDQNFFRKMTLESDTRTPIFVELPGSVGYHYPHLADDPENLFIGLHNRVAKRRPEFKSQVLRLERKIVDYLFDELIILPMDAGDLLTLDQYLEMTSYTESEKEVIRKAWHFFCTENKISLDCNIFVKFEAYDMIKASRGIFSTTNFMKSIVSPLVRKAEKYYFNQIDHHVKGMTNRERADKITNLDFSEINDRVGVSDYKQFESWVTEGQQLIENYFVSRMFTNNSSVQELLKIFYTNFKMKRFWAGRKQYLMELWCKRQSGIPITAWLNFVSNDLWSDCADFVWYCYCRGGKKNMNIWMFKVEQWFHDWIGDRISTKSYKTIKEGDDSIEIMPREKARCMKQIYAQLGIDIDAVVYDKPAEADFCGIIVSEGGTILRDAIKTIIKMGRASIKYARSKDAKLQALMLMKAECMLYEYPECPILSHYCMAIINKFSNADTQRFKLQAHKMMKSEMSSWEWEQHCARMRGYEEMDGFIQPRIPMEARLLYEKKFGITVDTQISLEQSVLNCTFDTYKRMIYHFVPPQVKQYTQRYVLENTIALMTRGETIMSEAMRSVIGNESHYDDYYWFFVMNPPKKDYDPEELVILGW